MKLILTFFFLLILFGCNNPDKTNIDVDHVNIWVKNPTVAKDRLQEIGFTAIPDSLCKIHSGQGTTGRYFYFLNGYLELIFVHNEKEFIDNAKSNDQLDFIERSNSPENGFSPFSVALAMKDYNANKIPFSTVKYLQEWMGENNAIYVAKNSKVNKEEPSLFVIYPEIQYDKFDNIQDLSKIPEEYSLWRAFYKHSNGAEKISKIEIHTTNIDKESNTISSISAIENVEIKVGDEYLMELYFDNQTQGKSYDLRPEIPLKIHL